VNQYPFPINPAIFEVAADMLKRELEARVRAAQKSRADWLEDVLAGLLINGVAMTEIKLEEHPHENRTVVVVRGVPMYEWRLNLTAPAQNTPSTSYP
jgi:hypothetical protein